jgi:hypothetical protein
MRVSGTRDPVGGENYTFAEATWSQGLSGCIGSHVRTFEFDDGSTEIVEPDSLRSGVTRACRYSPELNPTYHDLAMHTAWPSSWRECGSQEQSEGRSGSSARPEIDSGAPSASQILLAR